MDNLTPEQAAAREAANKEAQKQAALAQKQADKAAKEAERAAAKEAKEKAREAEKTAKAAQREAERVAKQDAKKAAELEKQKAKEAAKLEKEKSRMPEQNGIRRPKPETLCGQAWAIFDKVSAERGQPASIGEAMPIAIANGLNESNVRAEYARWRKFFGISGRIANPTAVAAPVGTEVVAPAE